MENPAENGLGGNAEDAGDTSMTVEQFMAMDEEARSKLPKSRLKKFVKLEEAYKKKQAKEALKAASAAAANAVSGGDDAAKQGSNKEKKVKNPTGPANISLFVNKTPRGQFKQLTETIEAGYLPHQVECAWYDWWESQGFFKPSLEAALHQQPEEKFIMVIPPPNVTGSLHLGHTLMCAVEDMLTRWHRMHGRTALWLPGIDHAGIATQVVVEKKIMREQQKSRHDLGREAFVNEVYRWKDEYGGKITTQLRFIGSSCDWSREEFTMSDKLSRAVKEAFVRMYDQGLIYREKRLVNWCCKLRTALSDIEVDYVELAGRTFRKVPDYKHEVEFGVLSNFSYKLADDPNVELVIATTRLETMLGDTAVAVHPDDPRYQQLIGKMLVHPFLERQLPIIGDRELVDMNFGTGCVKVTPAHDPNDFLCGRRHNLPEINIFTDDGLMNENTGKFKGMKRYEARKALEEELTKLGQFKGKTDNAMRLGVCSRTGDVIEPLLKPQWWVDCKKMGADAAQAVRNGDLKIVPSDFEPTWYYWLDNIKDWCISRQLWWGHRIPAYKVVLTNGNVLDQDVWVVGRDEEEAMTRAKEKLPAGSTFELHQDEDVLDTWFSSGLFPFSVFGWPDVNADEFKAFYPTTLLETGHDILFFWVARMVMMGLTLTGQLPFKTVYLHAMVRDKHGRKMSKSLGNIIDPLEVICGSTLDQLLDKVVKGNLDPNEHKFAVKSLKEEFPQGIPECGADALRYGLIAYTQQARNMNLDVQRVVGYRNFCNKLWNATRFALSNLGDTFEFSKPYFDIVVHDGKLSFQDMWILKCLDKVAQSCEDSFRLYNLSDVVMSTYNFWLYEFCDIYLEAIKPIMNGEDAEQKKRSQHVLYHCIHAGLRLLHPAMPFVTEELYQRLPNRRKVEPDTPSIMLAKYPLPEFPQLDKVPGTNCAIEAVMDHTMKCVRALRSLRASYDVQRSVKPPVYIVCRTKESEEMTKVGSGVIQTLASAGEVHIVSKQDDIAKGCGVSVVDDNCDAAILLKGLVDFNAELLKLEASAVEKRIVLVKHQEKMKAPDFTTKVPEAVQLRTREMVEKMEQELKSMEDLKEKFEKLLKETQ